MTILLPEPTTWRDLSSRLTADQVAHIEALELEYRAIPGPPASASWRIAASTSIRRFACTSTCPPTPMAGSTCRSNSLLMRLANSRPISSRSPEPYRRRLRRNRCHGPPRALPGVTPDADSSDLECPSRHSCTHHLQVVVRTLWPASTAADDIAFRTKCPLTPRAGRKNDHDL
jgi:hypothetical protein